MGQIRILSVDNLRNELIGENISKICGSKSGRWHSDDRLHCAHWVSHVLRWNNASSWPKCDDKAFGAVRGVQAIAGSCKNWQKFEPGKRPDRNACLVYVAPKGKFAYNKRRDSMRISGSRKHIGIYYDGTIFHYENKSDFEAAVAVPVTTRSGSKNFVNRYTKGDEHWASDFPKDISVKVIGSVAGYFKDLMRYINPPAVPGA